MLKEDKVWKILKDLPNLNRLEIYSRDLNEVAPLFLEVCVGLECLILQACDMTDVCLTKKRFDKKEPVISENKRFGIKELYISESCLIDIAGFARRCPHLKDLVVWRSTPWQCGDGSFTQRMEDLRKLIDGGTMRDLQDVYIDCYDRDDDQEVPY